jgi:hypothetical protein
MVGAADPQGASMTARYGVVANYDGDSVAREGAKCWIAANYCDTPRQNVWVRSRGGRWVEKYVAMHRLHSFRAAWLPPAMLHTWTSDDRKEAEQLALRLDRAAQDERARRNMRDIERMAGLMDENGKRGAE